MDYTTLIIGAGASKCYKMPIGSELRDKILEDKSKSYVVHSLDHCGINRTEYENFCDRLRYSGFSSVDAFLEVETNFINCGKFAIACTLLSEQQKAIDVLFPPKQPKEHWLEVLWGQIYKREENLFKKNKLKILNFNYDLLIEFYLNKLCKTNYGIEVSEIDETVEIIHLHGYLKTNKALFNERVNEARKNLIIVHEGEKSDGFSIAKEIILNSEKVLFLGFGYAKNNLNKFSVFNYDHKNILKSKTIVGTNMGIPMTKWNSIVDEYFFSTGIRNKRVNSISEFLYTYL